MNKARTLIATAVVAACGAWPPATFDATRAPPRGGALVVTAPVVGANSFW